MCIWNVLVEVFILGVHAVCIRLGRLKRYTWCSQWMTRRFCNSKCRLGCLLYLFQHLFSTFVGGLYPPIPNTSCFMLLAQNSLKTIFCDATLKNCSPSARHPYPNHKPASSSWLSVQSCFLTQVISPTLLVRPLCKQVASAKGKGEQLGWGTKWEILQLLSLANLTHRVPTPWSPGSKIK